LHNSAPYYRANSSSLSFNGGASFLGIGVSGSAHLSSDGGVRQARFEGFGRVHKPCGVCPDFDGSLVVEKAHVDAPIDIFMRVDASFMGVSISGDAHFSTNGGIKSFRLEGDANPLINGIKEGIRKALGGLALGDSFIADAIDNILSIFYVSAFRIINPEGTVFVTFECDITFFGSDKTLKFTLPRLPTNIGDLVELMSTLLFDIAQSLAPLKYDIQIGDPDRAVHICLPKFCWCEPWCKLGRALEQAGGNTSSPLRQSLRPNGTRTGPPGKHDRPRIASIDGPGNETDMVEDYDLYWQLYPGGKKFAAVLDDFGDPMPFEMDVLDYQRQVHDEEVHMTQLAIVPAYRNDAMAREPRSLHDGGAFQTAPVYQRQVHDEEVDMKELGVVPAFRNDATAREPRSLHDGDAFQTTPANAGHHGRELFISCGFAGCCIQLCAPTPLTFSLKISLELTTTNLRLSSEVRVKIEAPSFVGSWPIIDFTWKASIAVNIGTPTRNLCVLIPAIGDFINNAKVGGGELCGWFIWHFCIPIPEFHLKDFISCDALTF
jgi:hypothetical protein